MPSSLQRGRLDVDAPGQHHVAVEAADDLVLGLVDPVPGGVEPELRVVDALALGGQELHELGSAVKVRGSEDFGQVGAEAVPALAWGGLLGHVHSFEVTGLAGSPRAEVRCPGSRTRGWCAL
jgi:hypothetical protein